MFHRVPVADVRLGMYIVSIDCSWLNSPFWRSRFLLRDPADLLRLQQSGIEMVTIDDTRGVGLTIAPLPAVDPAPLPGAPCEDLPKDIVIERRSAARPRRRTLGEVDRARETVQRSKEAVTRLFAEVRLGHAVQVDEVAPMVDEIAACIERDRSAILNVTRLKNKDEYTYLHSVAVCALMINLARQVGLPEHEVQQAGIAGLLHDVGKMSTPREVLEKPGRLDPEERRIIEDHPSAGYRMLKGGVGLGEIVLDVCLHHHERIDGRGYPEGLSQEQLSVHARMSAICDVYDALTSHRPYKLPWSPSEALAKMMSWQGHFDQRLLRAFVASIGIFPLGGLVRLHSNRLAVVVGSNEESPTSPPVRVFYTVMPAGVVALEDVVTHNGVGGDPIIRGESGDQWFGEDWPAIRADVEAGNVPVLLLEPVVRQETAA